MKPSDEWQDARERFYRESPTMAKLQKYGSASAMGICKCRRSILLCHGYVMGTAMTSHDKAKRKRDF